MIDKYLCIQPAGQWDADIEPLRAAISLLYHRPAFDLPDKKDDMNDV